MTVSMWMEPPPGKKAKPKGRRALFPDNLVPELQDTYTINAYIYDLYDGDTVYYHASLGYNMWAAFQIGRLLHIDAPEIKPLETRVVATASKDYLWASIKRYALNRHMPIDPAFGYKLKLRSLPANNKLFAAEALSGKEKYGRWLVEVIGADDKGKPVNINNLMLSAGHAMLAPW